MPNFVCTLSYFNIKNTINPKLNNKLNLPDQTPSLILSLYIYLYICISMSSANWQQRSKNTRTAVVVKSRYYRWYLVVFYWNPYSHLTRLSVFSSNHKTTWKQIFDGGLVFLPQKKLKTWHFFPDNYHNH